MNAPTSNPLRRWAIRWTQPNGVTGLGDGYDDHEHAVTALRACWELEAKSQPDVAFRMRHSLEDRHAGIAALALATKHDAATCPACAGGAA